MTDPDATRATRDEQLAARFLADPSVSAGTGFGTSRGLRVDGRIFAIFGDDRLTLKPPRPRVDALVESGVATRFDPRGGHPMREWATVGADRAADWDQLADEALAFVRRG